MTALELRLYAELKWQRDNGPRVLALELNDRQLRNWFRDADALIRKCEAQIRRDAEEVRSDV